MRDRKKYREIGFVFLGYFPQRADVAHALKNSPPEKKDGDFREVGLGTTPFGSPKNCSLRKFACCAALPNTFVVNL